MFGWEENKPAEVIGKLRIGIYLLFPILAGFLYNGRHYPVQTTILFSLALMLPVFICQFKVKSRELRHTLLALTDLIFIGYNIYLYRNWSLFLFLFVPMTTLRHTRPFWAMGFVGFLGVLLEWLFLRDMDEAFIQLTFHIAFVIILIFILKAIALIELQNEQEKLEAERHLDELKLAHHYLKSNNRILAYLAQTDALTELYNYRFFEATIKSYFEDAKLFGNPLSLLMIDVDHFKNVNDTFGHRFGDNALKSIAHILRECVRKEDLVCRYGGEEFTVILPKTDLSQANDLAERICSAVRKFDHQGVGLEKITVSIGVSAYPEEAKSIQELSQFADQALYEAKRQGRDCVVSRRILYSNLPS